MVGNDIVDLIETRESTNWERPRFLDKIFTLTEKELITNSQDPFETVWRLWSMKESAYKVFIQTGGNRFFSPTKIECTLAGLNKGEVKIGTTELRTNTFICSDYIFSTATLKSPEIETFIFDLSKSNSERESCFMHQQVLNHFSKNKSLRLDELQIQKTKNGVPIVYHKNNPLNTSLSITHHGKYGAFSILKN